MKQCPNCGAQIADDSLFCAECGKEIPQGTVCPHCGASMNDGDAFCQNCGKKPTDTPIEANEAVYEGEKKSGFKKYLPYILGAVVVLAIIGYFNSKDSKGGGDAQTVAVDTMAVDSVASADEAPIADKNRVIADYDERTIYQGEYVFDAVLTDAALEKNNSTFTIKIDGNNVSIPIDDGKTMTGHIYGDDLGIEVGYDYGDDLHYTSMRLTPNDKEGKEWVGEYHPTGILFNVVMKLKECKQQGSIVEVTQDRAEGESEDISDIADSDASSGYSKYFGRWSHYIISEGQRVKVYTAIINSDMTARWIVYMPDGSVNSDMSFRQCVFKDGMAYFTDNGDTTIKMTPRFKLGTNGIQTADGTDLIKE